MTEWDQRVAELWAALDEHEPVRFRERIEALVAELPPGSPEGLFELASANDSTGRPDQAAPLYRQAIEAGLTGYRRRRAVIQLASTLRNLGHPEESVALLTAERAAGTDDPQVATLDDAVDAFLALALVDTGHERAAAGLALAALAKHLPRYNRSLGYYAGELGSAR
ncbi:MAG: tetratricopeptide repeat protein [Kibdelosporangium sp.]